MTLKSCLWETRQHPTGFSLVCWRQGIFAVVSHPALQDPNHIIGSISGFSSAIGRFFPGVALLTYSFHLAEQPVKAESNGPSFHRGFSTRASPWMGDTSADLRRLIASRTLPSSGL